jgi:hypothetical protein
MICDAAVPTQSLYVSIPLHVKNQQNGDQHHRPNTFPPKDQQRHTKANCWKIGWNLHGIIWNLGSTH